MLELIRSTIFHTPGNPFLHSSQLVTHSNGCLAIEGGRVIACGEYPAIRNQFPAGSVRDLQGGYILPGLIDTHVHYPQLRIIGSFGYELLDWLARFTLPEEARFAEQTYAAEKARAFVNALVTHGTTTALVFGSHFCHATAALFDAAEHTGLRLISGLVFSDRNLLPALHTTPDRAYRESRLLLDKVRNHPRLAYAVEPRFALSAGEPILDVCRTLLREEPDARFTTHLNENPTEVAAVAGMFPGATDYLDVYEQFGLIDRRSVLAHNVHPTDSELNRLAQVRASVAHCPCSNASLGSGIFPMRRHLQHGVHFSLGTDIGAGTGFGMLKEGLQAYLLQRLAPEPVHLSGSHLLYLATRAGAQALGMEEETGDFTPGKAADFLYIRPPEGSVLSSVLSEIESSEHALTAIFTLAGPESVQEVHIGGDLAFRKEHAA